MSTETKEHFTGIHRSRDDRLIVKNSQPQGVCRNRYQGESTIYTDGLACLTQKRWVAHAIHNHLSEHCLSGRIRSAKAKFSKQQRAHQWADISYPPNFRQPFTGDSSCQKEDRRFSTHQQRKGKVADGLRSRVHSQTGSCQWACYWIVEFCSCDCEKTIISPFLAGLAAVKQVLCHRV